MQCALCASPIAGDPDAMALICKNGHQDVVHDKCYKNRYSNEVYKKAQHGESTKYGRGPAKERCLHDGCSSFVKMKALGKMEDANGGGAAKEAKPNGAKNGKKAPQRRPPQEEGEWVDDEPKCQAFKADGTRCGRALAKDGKELLACRLHVDMLRKQKEFAENAAVEAAERERQAELELQAARERTDEILPELDKEALGLGQRGAIEIGDAPARSGPDEAEKAAARERAAARAARERAAAAPAKPAKWAAAEEGRNAKKGWRARASSCGWRHGEGEGQGGACLERARLERGRLERESRGGLAAAPPVASLPPGRWARSVSPSPCGARRNAAVDKTGLEDCPICLEEPADVQMIPCGHTCCGGCLDQWMSQKSSFASTLRAGSSDTTCPMCRQVVSETAAARPTAESAASALAARVVEDDDDADLDVDWIALANQRQAEVMAQARVLREELTAPELTAPLPTLPPPQPRRAPQAPIGTPQAPIGSQRAPIGTPNRQRQESAC